MTSTPATQFQLYACLPFIELAEETTLELGPVCFWPSSKGASWLEPENLDSFHNYIQTISQIKTHLGSKQANTVFLKPQSTTCISIAVDVDPQLREQLIVDAIYCFYFICNFRNLYYGAEVLPYDAFKKMIPATIPFISDRTKWESLFINEKNREETLCIHQFDNEILPALGKILKAIYFNSNETTELDPYRRVIRSIRYLIDRFNPRFMNLIYKEIELKESLFEPEDILFLSCSFESLFDIDDKNPTADFKHKLRPMLHLKYSTPVEIFWKWVDDFYNVKRKVVHSGSTPDPIFRSNPNFEISHIMLGIKLFIYATYHSLFQMGLLSPVHFDKYTPPDFRWIHPEEILLFFWTESSLLTKLDTFIKRAQETEEDKELYAEISLLCDLFLSIYERYYSNPEGNFVKFIPTPSKEILETGKSLLNTLKIEQKERPKGKLIYSIPNDLENVLKERLQLS